MKLTEELVNTAMCMSLILTAYTMSKTHVMNNLIMIEFMIITILMLMFKMTTMMNMENYLILYVIVTTISESMVGLSMMIAMIRTHSNDYLKSINLTQL